jgi:hypothetical protein
MVAVVYVLHISESLLMRMQLQCVAAIAEVLLPVAAAECHFIHVHLLGALHPSENLVSAYAVHLSDLLSLVGSVSAGSSEDVLCKEACCCPRVHVAEKHNASKTSSSVFVQPFSLRCINRLVVQRAASSSSVARQPDYVVYLISTQNFRIIRMLLVRKFAFTEASAAQYSRLAPDVCRGARCWRRFCLPLMRNQ